MLLVDAMSNILILLGASLIGAYLLLGPVQACNHALKRFFPRLFGGADIVIETAQVVLKHGITTVRDAGGADIGMKQSVEQGLVVGPRMQISVTALGITGVVVETDGDRLDALNEAILRRVNASGEVFLSHTKVRGRHTIRLAIGNLRTREEHVRRAWELLRDAAAAELEA